MRIDKKNICSTCQSSFLRDETFDSYFCPSCNKWQEETCDDGNCKYCKNRPERPLPIKR